MISADQPALGNPWPGRWFARWEFACRCGCGYDTVDAELLAVLDSLRYHYQRPITINSGCRCYDHNRRVDGEADSQHLLGRAADIVVAGILPLDVYNYLDARYPDQYGLGDYPTFVHIDTRPGRWRG